MTRRTAISPAISILAGLFLAVLCVPAGAQGPMGSQQQGGVAPMAIPDIHDYGNDYHFNKLPPEPQAAADGLRLQGRCDAAIPIYRALVNQGTGFELSQYNLGLCLLETAKKAPDPAAAAAERQEAASWALKAANKGLPNAQNGLIAMYLDGVGVAADPVEAGKWSLLYHSNAARRMYGLPDVTSAVQARLDAALNPNNRWAQAQAKADAWSPAP